MATHFESPIWSACLGAFFSEFAESCPASFGEMMMCSLYRDIMLYIMENSLSLSNDHSGLLFNTVDWWISEEVQNVCCSTIQGGRAWFAACCVLCCDVYVFVVHTDKAVSILGKIRARSRTSEKTDADVSSSLSFRCDVGPT